jgi:hypothetical protein
MNPIPTHPAAAPPPANFPVAWPSYGDSLMHWTRDAVRGPRQMSRLDASLAVLWTDAGYGHAQRVYGMPARVRHLVVNSWLYVSVEPVSHDAVELSRLRDGVEAAVAEALGSMRDRWSSRWLPETTRIGAELESAGTGAAVADLERIVTLGSRAWQIRTEMAVPAELAVRALERAPAARELRADDPRSPFDRPLPVISSLVAASASAAAITALPASEPPTPSGGDERASRLLAQASHAAGLGEQQRVLLDNRLNRAAVRAVTAAGRRLWSEELLDDPVDAFHLSLEELRHALVNGGDMRLRAAAGRVEMARYRGISAPPVLGPDGRLDDPFGWAIGDVRAPATGWNAASGDALAASA